MEKIVSVSLGSPARDFAVEVELLGRKLHIERKGVNGSFEEYFQTLRALDADPDVRAVGLGGINRYLLTEGRKHEFSIARRMTAAVSHKPVVDGSGLKLSLEPHIVHWLQQEGVVDFRRCRVLMTSATDRWGMAKALNQYAKEILFGDLMFALELPIPLRSWRSLSLLARCVAPPITRYVPFQWLYPTGETKVKPKFAKEYAWADVLAGDWKFIQRHLPEGEQALAGKAVLTNTVTAKDLAQMRDRGVSLLVTTTPNMGGRSFGTNVIEGVLVTLAGKWPEEMQAEDYLAVLHQLGWDRPRVEYLQQTAPQQASTP